MYYHQRSQNSAVKFGSSVNKFHHCHDQSIFQLICFEILKTTKQSILFEDKQAKLQDFFIYQIIQKSSSESVEIEKIKKKHNISFLLNYYSKQIIYQMIDCFLKNDGQGTIKKEEYGQNQPVFFLKKPSVLKKKKLLPTKLYSNIDLKQVVNIGDICFINENALRNPNTSEETLLKSLYHYNMISKVTLNNSFINVYLKKNCESILPPEYFIERLRSFGDRQMATMASNLEKINQQFCRIKDLSSANQKTFTRDNEEVLLKNFLQSKEGKKYFLYFSEISSQKITMKNIIFSVPLLQALGCNIKNIGLDFLKYKHVFFEVFTAKNYGNFLQGCFQKFYNIQTQLMLNPDISEQQRRALTEMVYYDEVIRRKEGTEGVYEQIITAKVMWYSPHPSICYFQILDFKETEGFMITKRQKPSLLEETNPEQEIQMLKKIGIDDSLLQIETSFKQKQKCNTTKELKSQFASEKECKIHLVENLAFPQSEIQIQIDKQDKYKRMHYDNCEAFKSFKM